MHIAKFLLYKHIHYFQEKLNILVRENAAIYDIQIYDCNHITNKILGTIQDLVLSNVMRNQVLHNFIALNYILHVKKFSWA